MYFSIFIYLFFVCNLCVRVCSFLCSDSLLYYIYFFLFLSILHGVYTRDCSWCKRHKSKISFFHYKAKHLYIFRTPKFNYDYDSCIIERATLE